jgi:YegS/Rv2252/BmrU family lipid kinase
VRPCVIFNPAAKGEKARRFRAELDSIATQSVFKLTTAAGDARILAAEAVREGHETIVAAGGDGTLNEVLNGIGDVPDGFARTRLGFMPLGTVNVLARELGIPLDPHGSWSVIKSDREARLDLPWMEQAREGHTTRRYFIQLAGAGLDARAIELVNWETKKKIGPLAYVLAGLRALRERPAAIVASSDGQRLSGELVLIGNGRLYGGNFRLFHEADMRDGLLDVCVFPRVGWRTLFRCSLPLMLSRRLPAGAVRRFQSRTVRLESAVRAPLEVDGELAGQLPAVFNVEPLGLRVLVPASLAGKKEVSGRQPADRAGQTHQT